MGFDVYGRFRLEVERENDAWEVYRRELGKRVKVTDLIVPQDLQERQIAAFLDDIFHELSGPGQSVKRLP